MSGFIRLDRQTYTQDAFWPAGRGRVSLRFVAGGAGILQGEKGKETPLRKGDVFWLPQARGARLCQPENLQIREAVFSLDFLPAPRQDAPWTKELSAFLTPEEPALLHLPMEAWTETEALLSDMERESRETQPGGQARLTGLMLCLVGNLLRAREESQAMPPDALEKALRHMEEHFSEELSLAEISALAGVSPRHFDRMFAATLGVTPKAYLARLRVARARVLLKTTRRPVTEIAFDCGYADSNYFARVFRRLTGSSPQQYRRGTEE